jgi:hypothetical protein
MARFSKCCKALNTDSYVTIRGCHSGGDVIGHQNGFPPPVNAVTPLTGEFGSLEEVFRSVLDESRCYLTIRHEGQTYIGVLRFDDSSFCKQISNLLQQNNGRAIHELASMEVGSSADCDREKPLRRVNRGRSSN